MYNFLKDARTIRNSFLCVFDTLDGYASDFHINGNVDGWDVYNSVYLYGSWNSVLFGTSYERSCYIGRSEIFVPIPAENFYYVKIMMKITNKNTDKAVGGLDTGRIQWTTLSDGTWNSTKQMDFSIVADDEWRLYTINMGPAQWWQGDITNLRIYPFIDGWPNDQFSIKYIKVGSTDVYKCSNTQCSYYVNYSHPCPGAGSRGSCEAATARQKYTVVSGVSDNLIVNIDGYGPVSFDIGDYSNMDGPDMARVLAGKISSFNIGGYAYGECEYTEFDKLKIISGVVGASSSVTVLGTAAVPLGFFSGEEDISVKGIGTDPATGFDYASSRLLTAREINKLINGATDDAAYIHDPIQYNLEGGREDYNTSGGTKLVSGLGETEYYDSLNNTSKTIIDLSHPFSSNGRLKYLYLAGRFSGAASMKIIRPRSNGTLSVVHSFDLPAQSASYIYTSIPAFYRIDCDVLVNRGDLIGIYNADVYVGTSLTGLPDATFFQVSGEVSGNFDPGLPFAFGVSGFAVYGRGDRYQSNIRLDIDLGDRVNIEQINIYGREDVDYFEFNLASCLDLTWDVGLFGESHYHAGVNWNNGDPFFNTHTNIYYGKDCLDDGVRTADNGQVGTGYGKDSNGLYTTGDDHSYFYVNGDAEWLYAYTNDGKHEYAWPYVPGSAWGTTTTNGIGGFIYDPISFTIKFPYEFSALVHRSIIYFKERQNFRGLSLSYYLGQYINTGNADDPNFQYVPSYTSVLLDGIYIDESNSTSGDYVYNNPMSDRFVYAAGDHDPINWREAGAALRTTWNVIEHNFTPVNCKGFRIYTNNHLSTKITEIEVYSKVATTPSLIDNVYMIFSNYGEVWNTASFTAEANEKIFSFVGGSPRYITIEFDAATKFTLNEIELLVGDQVKLENCDNVILLDHAKRGEISQSTSVELENVYGRSFDLIVDVPKETTNTDDVVFWSKMHSQSDLDNPQVGPPCRLYKVEDVEIGNSNYQCAVNAPAYGLKNLVHNKSAYYSYNDVDYFDFGTLTSGTSVDFCNTLYVGYRKTVLTFPASSSKYWKVFFPSASGPGVINDLLAYEDSNRLSVKSIFTFSDSGISSQSGEMTSDGVSMFEQDDVYIDDFEDSSYVGKWTIHDYNSVGAVMQETGGSLKITNYGAKITTPYGAYAEHVLEYPLSDFDFTTDVYLEHGDQAYFTIQLINGSSITALSSGLYDAWLYDWGYMSFSDRLGLKYNGQYDYVMGTNTIRIVRSGSTGQFYMNGNLRWSGTLVADIIYKVRYYFARFDYSPFVNLGVSNLQITSDVKPFIDNAAGFGFSLASSEPVNSITLIHNSTTANSAEIYTSPDNGNNYVKVANTSQVTINPKNASISTRFSIDLEKRHDLDIIRNYSSASDKYFLNLTTADYSNTNTDDVGLVSWDNSTYSDARWIRVDLPDDSPLKCIRKLGIYPDISSVFCQGGGYNCEWEPLGTILSDYTPSVNVAYGSTVTGTNYYFFTFYPDNTVDGVHTDYAMTSCWGFETIDGVDAYLDLDFGTSYTINRVVLYHGYSPDDSSYMNTAYTISVSPTASGSFTTVVTEAGNTEFTTTHQFDAVEARRLKLTITGYNTQRMLIQYPETGEYLEFLGSFLREIEVYTYTETGYVDSETWPIVCMNMADQFSITDHDLVNKDITDSVTDWDNAETFFKYSDDLFDNPQKVSFADEGELVVVYQKIADSGSMDKRTGIVEYLFDSAVYFYKGIYMVEWDAKNSNGTGTVSLRLEGPYTIDHAVTLTSTSYAHQLGTIEVPEGGFYDVKGFLDEEYTSTVSNYWAVRNPTIYRAAGLRKWVAVERDTATDYAYDGDAAKKGIDYLSLIKVYGDEEYKPFEYNWWWTSALSTLSNDALNTVVGRRSLKISYPTGSGVDTIILREGDSLSDDIYFDAKNFLHFWWYIDDVSKFDTSFGNLKFGNIYEANPIYYQWDISSLSLSSGWNDVNLKFEEADYTYPTVEESIDFYGDINDNLDFRNNSRDMKSFILTYRGLNQPIVMNLDDLRMKRNIFDDDVNFGKGLFLNGYDYLEIPVSTISLERGTVEFWFKSFFNYYGADIFENVNSRVLFTMVNNNNDVVSLGVRSAGWLMPLVGKLQKSMIEFEADDNTLLSSLYINRGDVIHIALVWNNDGSFMNNGDTIRLYMGGILTASSKEPWSVDDTKAALIKLGGPNTQFAYNYDIWGGGIFENVKMYNYCKTSFNTDYEGIEKDVTYTPNDFLEISQDGVNFYGVGSAELPFVFEQVPNGDSKTIYIRTNKTDKFKQSKSTATLIVEWLSSV